MKAGTTSLPNINQDAIVISGISGLFPNADNTLELAEKLYNKVDMMTGDVYPDIKHPELPQHYGKINNISKFDSQFFRVTPKQSESFEPCGRKLMEMAYSAIFDAGVNPETLKGTKLGVFVGFSQSDISVASLYRSLFSNGFIISGCSKTMLANRVSYWIDAKSPSCSLDFGCASSMACLEIACERIMGGECDAALVAGCSYNNKPVLTINMKRAGLLCLDGKTKCFTKNGDGYVRSHAVSVLFLQKAKDAKRIYSEICHVKGKYFAKPDSTFLLPTRDAKSLQNFFEEFYSKININPDDVEYIEANCPGIVEADESELYAISEVFGKNKPVKIGCIKSNLGHTESASGIVGITKVCLAYQRGELPPILHFTEPLDIPNNLQLVTDTTSFNRGYTAINNFGFTGGNFHVLLRCPYIPKETNKYSTEIPRLVLVSGRTEKGIHKLFDYLENNPLDPEQIALINDVFKNDIPGHTIRGFAIFDSNINESRKALSRKLEHYSGTKRPVCFMYSGMGSQWAGMGAELMQIPIFCAAIKKCQKVLECKGLDLIDIITNTNYDITSNVLYSLTGITALQIGLTDVLKAMGLTPDFIIGHSLGEIGCSYADGCLTAEEAILVSYNRGLVSAETEFIKGKMAAIGLGYKKVQVSCPAEIDIACHNSSESTTISGPADAVDEFVENLTERNVFAKIVASSDIAFHSRYIAKAGSNLLALLNGVIKEPKQRSEKWLSTCYMPEEWDFEENRLASAKYFTHNLLNKVLFEEAAKYIPQNAIIIEIAPYGLLQSILKKSHATCLNLGLLRRNHNENVKILLESIGKLYQNSLNPQIDVLYPKVDFPVSTETPVLAHLVDWEHSVEWDSDFYESKTNKHTAMYAKFDMSIYDDEYGFINNYVRNGEKVFPESILIVLVWKTLAMYMEVNYIDLAVEFEDIKFHADVLFRSGELIQLSVFIRKGSNRFEVTQEEKTIVSGYIHVKNLRDVYTNNIIREFDYHQPYLDKDTIYKLLNMHGYNLKGEWLSIKAMNLNKFKAIIEWTNDWIYLIDSLLQLNILSQSEYLPSKVKFISSLHIDVNKHIQSLICDDKNGEKYLYADRNAESGVTLCGGVICKSIVYKKIPMKQTTTKMYTQKFIPHLCNYPMDIQTAIYVNMQIVYENSANEQFKVNLVKTKNNSDNNILSIIKHTMSELSITDTQLKIIEANDVVNLNLNTETTDVVICTDFFITKIILQTLRYRLNNNLNVMLIGCKSENICEYIKNNEITLITTFDVDDKEILLIKKKNEVNLKRIVISSSLAQFKSDIQKEIDHNNIIHILENKTFINPTCYKDTIKHRLIKGITMSLLDVDKVQLLPLSKNIFLKNQIEKGLAINILRNEQWGGYYHVPFKSNVEVRNVELASNLNNFDALEWTESPTIIDSNMVQVHFSGVVMKDCEDLLNEHKMSSFGMDYSGIDTNDQRIMGCVEGGSMASSIKTDPNLVWPVPKHWSLEDAATVPLPYVHAYYCLAIKYNLLRGRTVLITGGSGALGQALISVCLSFNCKVFATVSSERKKKLLIRLFPEIEEKNIELSNTTEFGDNIRKSTNCKRCNVVINCYGGEIRRTAMTCVSEFGTFLDLSQDDMKENESFGFGYLNEDKSYVTVRLSSIFTEENTINKKKLQAIIAEGIAKGIVKPMNRTVFSQSDISRAFKLMTMRRHAGRILINMKENTSKQNGEPRLTLNPDEVYIVIWDGSDIGVELINRLIERGAKNLIINQRQKSINGYYDSKSRIWKQSVKIELNTENLDTVEECKRFIKSATKMGPIDGVFTVENYLNGNDCIETILSNIHIATRGIKHLTYFVCASLIPHTVSDVMYTTTQEYFTAERKKMALPYLHFVYKLREIDFSLKTVLTFLNGFEKSLKQKYSNILLTDIDSNNSKIPVVVDSNNTTDNSENKLNILINDIENKEIQATELIFSIKTLISEFESNELISDPNEDMAMVISGFLGNHKTLSKSTERLKISAYCLQIAPDLEGSILDLANNLLKYVKMRFKLKSKFHIVAHSFGVNIALEMAALLEKEGYRGIIFCLDSSPLALQHQIKGYLGDLTEDQLQNSIIEHTYSLLAGNLIDDLRNDLKDSKNWSDKTTLFINDIKHKVSHSHQYLKDLINAIYKRILLAKEYKPDMKLDSEVVLIKGQPDPKIDILPEDYDLSKYTAKPLKVFNVASDHLSLRNHPNISNIINELLEPEILELYEKKNLCQVYYD